MSEIGDGTEPFACGFPVRPAGRKRVADSMGMMGIAMAAGLALSACDDRTAQPKSPATPATTSHSTEAAPAGSSPAWAAAYPGSHALDGSGAATEADGALTFTTTDDPQAVIDFYEKQATAAGLATVSALRQGRTLAYAAVDPEGRGHRLQVFVAPSDEAGVNRVSLSWTTAP